FNDKVLIFFLPVDVKARYFLSGALVFQFICSWLSLQQLFIIIIIILVNNSISSSSSSSPWLSASVTAATTGLLR
ncbi:unnamed protein product, partial [Brassica oleracea]